MKSVAISIAAYAFSATLFTASVLPTGKTVEAPADIPAATGIMLDEVTISSLPTYTLPEVVVSTKPTTEHTLPEVVITAAAKPRA